MEMVRLKNGSEEAKGLVAIVMLSLRSLLAEKPLVFHDLVMVCRDGTKPWSDMTPAVDAALMESDGRVHDSIRHVIVSAVTGDGLDMLIGDPTEAK